MREGVFMKFHWIFGLCLLCAVLVAFNLKSTNENISPPEDIHRVMQQILQQHLKSNTMSDSLIRDSVRQYIDQFDPARIYLLEREVAHYQNLSDREVAEILKQYQESNYAIFTEIDQVIQQSIMRARELREKIEQEKASLFQKQTVEAPKSTFPKTLSDLKERIKNDMTSFVIAQKNRFGESVVMKHPGQTIENYEARAQEHEDQYLFVDEAGHPLSQEEQANLFSLHILKALAKSLDKNTDYLSPSEANDLLIRLEKGYPGIGILMQQRPNGVYITRLTEHGPAERSGKIKINDRLIAVNGVSVDKKSIEEILPLLHGQKGTPVELSLERKVKEEHRYIDKPFTVTLQREFIPVNEGRVTASYDTMGNGIIGKVKLDSFYRGENGVTSENDMRRAIQNLDKQGNMRGLIIDMRENTGGFLTEAVKVAGLFITNGVIVTAKYSDGSEIVFRDVDNHELFGGPIVILTSKATASAAEIVAQALQDYGVALVVGDEKTYGKGTIQNQTVTQDKGSTYFKVTIGKYFTVSGKTPDQVGVKADIVVPSQFSFLNFGNEYITRQNETIPPAYADNLEGVPPENRDWYLRYYVPTLQHKIDTWRTLLPILKKNSQYRISKNKDFQLFLKHSGVSVPVTAEQSDEEEESSHEKNYGMEDLQMAEAVNIVRDMIILHHRIPDIKIAQAAEKDTKIAECKK